jgi:hypothetical protein
MKRVTTRLLATMIISVGCISSGHAQGRAWGAIAVCDGPQDGCVNSSTPGGANFGPTRQAAIEAVLADCRANLNPGFKCHIAHVFHHGCAYFAAGCTSQRCGWAIGSSQPEAIRKCIQRIGGGSCQSEGGCAGP